MKICESKDCVRIAEYELDGKKYCLRCYEKLLKIELPKGKAAMGAVTAMINDCM